MLGGDTPWLGAGPVLGPVEPRPQPAGHRAGGLQDRAQAPHQEDVGEYR